ncbi:MAG: hypothetical protein HY434_02735 [Candidatus Liptonbacteria bacterium]|nr:hypothetical protein [Candidatus Liptonbacteria bacterium]
MSKSPENNKSIEQPRDQAGSPSKERQRELKRAAKDAAKKKQPGGAKNISPTEITTEQRREAAEQNRRSLENMIREAQTRKEAKEVFDLFRDERLVTEERFHEIMREWQKEREAAVAGPTVAPIEEVMKKEEQAVNEVTEAGVEGGIEAEPLAEPVEVEKKETEGLGEVQPPEEVETAMPGTTETAETQEAQEETRVAESQAKPPSTFLSRVKASLSRVRAIEREKREKARSERRAQGKTASGRIEERGKQTKSTKGRLGGKLTTSIEEARGEFADEDRFLEDDFVPSSELAQKQLEVVEIRAEAESLWEKIRDREFDVGLIPSLQVVARKDALANYLEREAKVVEMKERREFIEDSRRQERTASRGDAERDHYRDYLEYLKQLEPPTLTTEEIVSGGKVQTNKAERERASKLLRNVGNLADSLRREIGGPKKERRYETSREYGKILELLLRISRAEDVDLALENARDRNLLSPADYDEIVAGLKEREEVAPDLNGYMNDIDLRYASGEIENGEDWDRLKSVAESVFANTNPAGEAERACVLKRISGEEKDRMLRYIKRSKGA